MALEVGLMNILVGLGLAPGSTEGLGKEVGEGLGSVADKIGKDFSERIGKGFERSGKFLTKTVTAPLVAGAGAIINSAMKQDEALDFLRTSTGATGDEFVELGEVFKNVAGQVAVPYEAIAPVIAELNQRLGLTGEPLEKLSAQLLDLQQVTGQAVDAEGIAKLFQAFQVPAEKQEELLNVIFRASQETGVAFDTLLQQVLSGAANFQEFGFSAEEAVGFLGSLEQSGIDSAAVLAGLRKGLAASLRGNKDIQKIEGDRAKSLATIDEATRDLAVAEQKLNELRADPKTKQSALIAAENDVAKLTGIIAEESKAVEGFNAAIADSAKRAGVSTEQFFNQTIAQIEQLLATGDDAAARQLIGEVFGTKNIAPVLSAIERGATDYKAFTQGLVEGGDTISGVADETADFSEQFQQFRNQLDNDLGEIGQEIFPVISEAIKDFTPVIRDLIVELGTLAKDFVPVLKDVLATALPIIKDLVQRFQDLSPETKKIVTQLVVFAGVLGPVLGPISKLVPLIGGLAKVFNLLRIALVANPWILAIAAIAGAAFLIYKNWDSIKEFFSNLFEAIGRAGAAVFDGLVAGAAVVVEFIIGVFQSLGGALATVWEAIRAAGIAVWDALKAAAQFAVDVIIGFFYYLGAGFVAIWDGIRAVAQGVWDGLAAAAKFVVDLIVGYFTGLVTFYTTVWSTIGDLARGAFEGVVGIASGVVDRIKGVFSGLRDFFSGIWQGVQRGAETIVRNILGLFTGLRDRVVDLFRKIASLPRELLSGIPGLGAIFGARADGGPVEGGKPYLVGERGPELVVPRTSGMVLSNEQLAGALSGGGRGGDSYNITITNPEPEPASVTIPQALRRASYLRSR